MGGIFKAILGVVEIVVGVILTIYGGAGIGLIISGVATLAGGIAEMSASKPQPKAGSAGGTSEQIAYDPSYARHLMVGTGYSAGSIVNSFSHDHLPAGGGNEGKNRVKELIIQLEDHECDSLVEIWNGSAKLTLGTLDATLGYAITGYNSEGIDHLYIKFFAGGWTQAADAHLIAISGGRWTSASKGRWCCYARVTMVASKDSDDTAWAGGQPQLKFVIKGKKLYDPRKDSSVGGSGSHRFNDTTTYEWSDNAALVHYNIVRGMYRPDGKLFYGVEASHDQVRFGDAVAAMNACDESVALKAGGTEKRYRVGGEIDVSVEVRTTLTAIEQSMAGKAINVSGTWRIFAGVAQTPVLAITDTDVMPQEQASAEPKFQSDSLVNAVYATYIDPLSGYSLKALPVRRNDSDIAEDGGIERKKDLQFDFVQSFTQCQRIMEIERKKGRCQIRQTRVAPPYLYVAEPGDWLNWTSARYTYTSKPFELLGSGITPKLDIQLTLAEITSTVFSWTAATDELPAVGGIIPSADPPSTLIPTGVVLAPGSQSGAGGSSIPVLGITFDPPNTAMVTGITFQYRQFGTTVVHSMTAIDANDASAALRTMLLPDVQYEGRLKFNTPPGFAANWSAWQLFTVPGGFVLNPGADPVTAQLQRALSSAKPIRDTVADSQYFPWLDQLEAAVAAATATIADHQNTIGIIHDAGIVKMGDGTVRISSVDALTAVVNGVTASVTTVQQAMVDLQGRTSAYWQLTVTAGGEQAYARLQADNTNSAIILAADMISLVSPLDGSLVPALTIKDGNVYVANKIYIGTNLYLDRTVPGLVYNDGVVAAVFGARFGKSADLVFWYGLAMDTSLMTTANGVFTFSTTGDAYFGGRLSAGISTTKAKTTSSAPDAVAETAIFGYAGHALTITSSYGGTSAGTFTYSDHATYAAACSSLGISSTLGTQTGTDGPIQATLYRSIDGSAYSAVQIYTTTTSWTAIKSTDTDGPGGTLEWRIEITETAGMSNTWNDDNGTPSNRQYKIALTAFASKEGPLGQTLSLICVEDEA